MKRFHSIGMLFSDTCLTFVLCHREYLHVMYFGSVYSAIVFSAVNMIHKQKNSSTKKCFGCNSRKREKAPVSPSQKMDPRFKSDKSYKRGQFFFIPLCFVFSHLLSIVFYSNFHIDISDEEIKELNAKTSRRMSEMKMKYQVKIVSCSQFKYFHFKALKMFVFFFRKSLVIHLSERLWSLLLDVRGRRMAWRSRGFVWPFAHSIFYNQMSRKEWCIILLLFRLAAIDAGPAGNKKRIRKRKKRRKKRYVT